MCTGSHQLGRKCRSSIERQCIRSDFDWYSTFRNQLYMSESREWNLCAEHRNTASSCHTINWKWCRLHCTIRSGMYILDPVWRFSRVGLLQLKLRQLREYLIPYDVQTIWSCRIYQKVLSSQSYISMTSHQWTTFWSHPESAKADGDVWHMSRSIITVQTHNMVNSLRYIYRGCSQCRNVEPYHLFAPSFCGGAACSWHRTLIPIFRNGRYRNANW